MSFDLKLRNGDLVLSNGDFKQITGTEKLSQDLIKIALTDVGANPLNPWYGSYVSKSLIGSYLDPSILITMAQSQLQNSIENLKTLQTQQSTQTFQKVSPDELISAIKSITIQRNTINPTLFSVDIQVLSKAFARVQVSFSVS